jgi:hypothetical protein
MSRTNAGELSFAKSTLYVKQLKQTHYKECEGVKILGAFLLGTAFLAAPAHADPLPDWYLGGWCLTSGPLRR